MRAEQLGSTAVLSARRPDSTDYPAARLPAARHTKRSARRSLPPSVFARKSLTRLAISYSKTRTLSLFERTNWPSCVFLYLEQSCKLRKLLQNEEIRQIVQTIDSSTNPLGALRSVLGQDKNKESPFQTACDEMLKAMGLMTADGQFKF